MIPNLLVYRINFQDHLKNDNKRFSNFLVHPEGLEPTTLCSEDRCSNPLSYGCNYYLVNTVFKLSDIETT